jgi:hypothetical protein
VIDPRLSAGKSRFQVIWRIRAMNAETGLTPVVHEVRELELVHRR